MLKDLMIAVEACQKMNVEAKLGKEAMEIYKLAVDEGFGGKDFGVIYDILEKKRNKKD